MAGRANQQTAAVRPEEEALLQAIVAHPYDVVRWLILADWLEEHDDPRRAELLRLHRQLIATCRQPDRHPERVGQQARMVQMLMEGVRPCVPRRTIKLARAVEMTLAWIPPGSFLMGSPEGEEGRKEDEAQHQVTLTQGFWLAVTPVTQRQGLTGMRSNPSYFKGKEHPAEGVSWKSCQAFCQQLSERLGTSLRLPTEAEWEYACRAGTTTRFFFGDSISSAQANLQSSVGKTTTVGSHPWNAWGLHDLHGNVLEWCQDWYAPYDKEAVQDPKGPATGTSRVLRGGSWYTLSRACRAAQRLWAAPNHRCRTIGFRVVVRLD